MDNNALNIATGIFDNVDLMTQLNFIIRIICAAICGGVIGYERSRRSKGAGVRTHMVVALSAALMTIVSKYGFIDMVKLGFNADASRVASNIVTGIPFLGAGIILVRQNQASVQGLTTAAGIFATAGIGMAWGSGLYIIGLFATVFLMVLQFVLHKILTGYDNSFVGEVIVHAGKGFNVNETVCSMLEAYRVTLLKAKVRVFDTETLEYRISFKTMIDIPPESLAEMIESHSEIISIEI